MRLINAEDVIIRLHVDPEEWGTPDERWLPEREYAMAIMTSPEIDPVKHGWWIERRDGELLWDECSTCGYVNEYERFPYCPNCGAKMDGEEE